MKHQKAMDYIYIQKKSVNQALLSNRASYLIKQRLFASNGRAEVNFLKKKKENKFDFVASLTRAIKS